MLLSSVTFIVPISMIFVPGEGDRDDLFCTSPNFRLSLMGTPLVPLFRISTTTLGPPAPPFILLTMLEQLLFATYKVINTWSRCLHLGKGGRCKR